MSQIVVCPPGREKHFYDSWSLERILASLIVVVLSLAAGWWQFSSYRLVSKKETAQSLTKTSPRQSENYFSSVSAISVVFFFVVIILYIYIKATSLTFSKPFSERTSSKCSVSSDEVERSSIYSLSSSLDDQDGEDIDFELSCHEPSSIDKTLETYAQLFDILNNGDDKLRECWPTCEDLNDLEDLELIQLSNSCSILGQDTYRTDAEDALELTDISSPMMIDKHICSSSTHEIGIFVVHGNDKNETNIMMNLATQTDDLAKPDMVSTETMTCNPFLVDASVGSHKVFKIVRSCNTSTSGRPFMKKLRRAQRLLNEAKIKIKKEHQSKLIKWKIILNRYQDRVKSLHNLLDKKDILMSYTALNRALCENEVKDMCTAVSSAKDRLLTQCKLNFALKEVVESKCDAGTSDSQGQSSGGQG